MDEGSCLAFSSFETIGRDITLDRLNIHHAYPTHRFQHLMDKIHLLFSSVKFFSENIEQLAFAMPDVDAPGEKTQETG
ncbi:MAG: hypothetical protein ABIJ52_17870 [Pseudomonadota bacterium]